MPSSSQLLAVRFRSLIDELQSANQELRTDTAVEAPLLRELRQALDNLRLTAWTVSELQNAPETSNDAHAVISFLTAERMRRFRQMIDDFCSDLDHSGIAWPSASVYGLQESVNVLRERLGLMTFRRRGIGSQHSQ